MTIHLSKDQQRFIHDAVRAGIYVSEDAVISDALDRLRQTMPKSAPTSEKKARATKTSQPQMKPLTIDEIHRQMMARGLITSLPDPSQDIDDDDLADAPIVIKGEPLSKTIIRERR